MQNTFSFLYLFFFWSKITFCAINCIVHLSKIWWWSMSFSNVSFVIRSVQSISVKTVFFTLSVQDLLIWKVKKSRRFLCSFKTLQINSTLFQFTKSTQIANTNNVSVSIYFSATKIAIIKCAWREYTIFYALAAKAKSTKKTYYKSFCICVHIFFFLFPLFYAVLKYVFVCMVYITLIFAQKKFPRSLRAFDLFNVIKVCRFVEQKEHKKRQKRRKSSK